jgi:multidrug efflux pump subunit AcrA (membrane-fusion protein)
VSGPCGRYREAAKHCLLFGLAGLSIWFAGCVKKTVVDPEPPEVYIAKPLQRVVSIYSDWIGTPVGFVDAQIHSQVTGYLLSQNYKEGSLVKKGDLLFQVDPRPFQVLVDQARAKVEAAKTQLTEAKAEVDQAKAEIDRAQAALGKTELDVKRYSPLVADGTVSQQELDDAQSRPTLPTRLRLRPHKGGMRERRRKWRPPELMWMLLRVFSTVLSSTLALLV